MFTSEPIAFTIAFTIVTALARCREVMDASFSDALSKNLVIVYGAPDRTIVTYRWYSEKVIGSVRVDRGATRCSFDPATDVKLVALAPTAAVALDQDLKNETYLQHTLLEVSLVRSAYSLYSAWRLRGAGVSVQELSLGG
jgi:hypothetical protein